MIGGNIMRFRAALLIGMVSAVMASGPAYAQELRSSLVVSAGADVTSNPFLNDTVSSTSVAGKLDLLPSISFVDDQTTAQLSGSASFRQYSKKYGLIDNYAANLLIAHRASAKLSLNAGANFDFNESQTESLRFIQAAASQGLGPSAPLIVIDPALGTDVTTLGLRTRTKRYGGNIGAAYFMDARNQFRAGLSARTLNYGDLRLANNSNYSVDLGYYHVVNSGTGFGVNASASQSKYNGNQFADSRTYTVSGNVSHNIGERLTLNASVGASFSRLDALGIQPKRSFTSLSTGASACYKGQIGDLCLNYQRSPQPTAQGGLRSSDNIDVSYQKQTSPGGRLMASAGYNRSANKFSPAFFVPTVEFLQLRGRYEQDYGQRLTAFASAGYGKIYRSDLTRAARVEFSVGVSYKFGDPR
jgi:hypothetical protein